LFIVCGLFSSVGIAVDQDRIDVVAHRGPDGRGWRTFDSAAGPVALGHRRLAIIDTSPAGLQPMACPSGRFHLILNGEIYNYVELRELMRSKGEVFVTQSDTEVLLRAYIIWGDAVLERLRGMFAFLIWDDRDKRLFAARDRFGIKPLYVARCSNGIAFGSEIKQLIGLPGVSARMNVRRVREFLSQGIADHTCETMFHGILQVRAGECVTIDASKPSAEAWTRRGYSLAAGVPKLTENEAAERFRQLLTESVRLHLRADVPVGSCLSGGLDSSSLVCLMSRLLESERKDGSVHTVSACYSEKAIDESPFIELVAAQANAAAHFVFPKAEDLLQKASDITWHQDEPFYSTSVFAQWCVFEEARRIGLKVMLDGQGADEQLAGYHGSFPYYLAHLTRQGQLREVVSTIIARQRDHGASLAQQLSRYMLPFLPKNIVAHLYQRHHGHTQFNWMVADPSEKPCRRTGPLSGSPAAGLPPVTDLNTLCQTLIFGGHLQMLLHWEDRNSMAHSLEARVPFLDHPLVEFNLALGNDHKIVRSETKHVLRKAMTGILPEIVQQRRDKLSFDTPEQTWFQGPLRGALTEGIESTLSRYPDLLNADGVRAMTGEMLEGQRPVDFTLWRIVNLGLWGARFGVTL
jgi:asparagine synthase (glutamine-hydrolysing)